jgi:HEAT repeat protein
MSLLVKGADECVAQGDTAGLFAVLAAMEDQARGCLGQEASRRVVAASALARSSSEGVGLCVRDGFDRSPEERRKSTIGLLGVLGEPGARALCEIIATGGETDFARAVRAVLANDSRGVAHVRDLLSRVNRSRAERILAVLLEARGADAPDQLAAAVDDAPEAVRLSLIRMVQKSGRARFATPLIRWVSDAPCTVRLAAMRALGELRVLEAVPALMDIVNLESNFGEGALLKEAAVDALAGIGATGAVPKLCELLEGGLILSMIGSPRPRVAAARALGELGGPDARHTLEKGSRSAHRGVRRASQRAYARLRAREGMRAGRLGNVR